jgi:hypothetical protein
MTHRKHWKILAIAAVILASCTAALTHSTTGKAAAGGDDSESRIQKGFASAPVNLNLTGKNRALVGLGSYLVNTAGDCNGCHHKTLSDSSPYTPMVIHIRDSLRRWNRLDIWLAEHPYLVRFSSREI